MLPRLTASKAAAARRRRQRNRSRPTVPVTALAASADSKLVDLNFKLNRPGLGHGLIIVLVASESVPPSASHHIASHGSAASEPQPAARACSPVTVCHEAAAASSLAA